MSIIKRLVGLLTVLFAMTGCTPAQMHAIDNALSDVAIAVADGATALDAIETLANLFFLAAPDPAEQAKVAAALEASRAALSDAARVTQSAKAGTLTQAAVEQAFKKFRMAYGTLIDLLSADHIAAMGPDGSLTPLPRPGKFGAAVGQGAPAKIPAPLALSIKVHQ